MIQDGKNIPRRRTLKRTAPTDEGRTCTIQSSESQLKAKKGENDRLRTSVEITILQIEEEEEDDDMRIQKMEEKGEQGSEKAELMMQEVNSTTLEEDSSSIYEPNSEEESDEDEEWTTVTRNRKLSTTTTAKEVKNVLKDGRGKRQIHTDSNLLDGNYKGTMSNFTKLCGLRNLVVTLAMQQRWKDLNGSAKKLPLKTKTIFIQPDLLISEQKIGDSHEEDMDAGNIGERGTKIGEPELNIGEGDTKIGEPEPTTREWPYGEHVIITEKDMGKGWNAGTNILDLEWKDLPMITGLGHQLQFIPEQLVPEVRRVYNNLLIVALAHPGNERAQKKIAVFWVVILTTDKNTTASEKRSHMKTKLAYISKDEWSEFMISNFNGRSEGWRRGQSAEEKGAAAYKLDMMSEVEKSTPAGQQLLEEVMGPKRSQVAKNMENGDLGKAHRTLTNKAQSATPGTSRLQFIKDRLKRRTSAEQEKLNLQLGRLAILPQTVTKIRPLTGNEYLKQVKSITRGTAAGPDGCAINVLKQVVQENPIYQEEIEDLKKNAASYLTNVFCTEKLPLVRAFMNSNEALVLTQQGVNLDGERIEKDRLVGKGNMYQKIMDRVTGERSKPLQRAVQEGVQFAGAKNGGEQVLHLARYGMDCHKEQIYQGMDQKMAFNNLSTSAVMEALITLDPETAEYARLNTTEGDALTIYHGLESGIEGITQEDGQSPGASKSMPYFNMGTQSICDSMSKVCRESGGVFTAYADDYRVRASHEANLRCIEIMKKDGREIGLVSNTGKNLILLGQIDNPNKEQLIRQDYIIRDIQEKNIRSHPDSKDEEGNKRGDRRGLYGHMINGIPTGSMEFVKREIEALIQNLRKICEDYRNLEDSQVQYHLMKSVLDKKITHLLRQLNPKDGIILALAYNKLQQESLRQMLRVPRITDLQMSRARLDTKDGGLGLLDAVGLVDAASVASLISSLPAIVAVYPEILEEIRKKKSDSEYISLSSQVNELYMSTAKLTVSAPHVTIDYLLELTENGKKDLQKKLHRNSRKKFTQTVTEQILESSTASYTALLSSSGVQASAWLQAQPTGQMKMTNSEFENSVRNRLFMAHPYIKHGTECLCDEKVDGEKITLDPEGIHCQKCRITNTQKGITHDGLVDVFIALCKSGQTTATKQCTNLLDNNGVLDILLLSTGDRDMGLDIRITNPINAQIERDKRKKPPIQGDAALRSEKEKEKKYMGACKRANIDFLPIVMETYGTWGAVLQCWFKKMIKNTTRACNVPSSSLTSYWTQTIAVALQKRISKAQIISANKVYAVRHLEKKEDMNSYHMENHLNWENQGSRT